jgi:AAA domain
MSKSPFSITAMPNSASIVPNSPNTSASAAKFVIPDFNPFLISNANEATIEPLRIMIYGAAKTRKTMWAGTAGETHRVTLLDGENGSKILNVLPESTQANIQKIPLAGRPMAPALCLFVSLLFKVQKFLWSITEERIIDAQHANPEHHYINVDLSLLTTDDVLIIDSWTKISADSAIQYMVDKNIDPFQGKKKEFDFYGYQDLVLDVLMGAFSCLPCHLIVIGHQEFHTNEVKEGFITKKITRQQVVSSSGKHGAKIPRTISDVLFFESVEKSQFAPHGDTLIHTGGNEFRDGGCRSMPPATHKLSEFKFKDFLKLADTPVARSLTRPKPEAFQYLSGHSVLKMIGR